MLRELNLNELDMVSGGVESIGDKKRRQAREARRNELREMGFSHNEISRMFNSGGGLGGISPYGTPLDSNGNALYEPPSNNESLETPTGEDPQPKKKTIVCLPRCLVPAFDGLGLE